ncbi:MAG: FtsX-like permease family protein [Clostridiales bacterium]|nr:FtsX-like permease family protein [Clostridiales bacterium]
MKRTQRTDSISTIRRQIVSYISVIVIAALAASIFLSVSFASKTILNNGDDYYKQGNWRDAELYYNYGARQEDIDYFASLDGIRASEGEFKFACLLSAGENGVDVDVLSLTHTLNTPILLEGTLPSGDNECLIEQSIADENSIHIGDRITLTDRDGAPPEELLYGEYTVTGIMYHPNNLCITLYTQDNPCIVIPLEGFNEENRHGLFTSVLLSFNCTEGMSRFDPSYLEAIRDMETELSPVIEERGGIIYSGLQSDYNDLIGTYRIDLDNSRELLNDARENIDNGWAELADGEAELEDAAIRLEDSRQQLEDAETRLENGRIQLDDARTQLNDAWIALQNSLAQLENGEAELAPHLTELQAGRARLDEAQQQLAEADSQLQYLASQINDGRTTLDAAGQQLAAAEAQLNEAQAQIDSHAAEVAQIETELTSATDTINNNVVPFASNLHSVLKWLIGDYADIFDWSQVETPIDYHDRDAHINRYILPGGITIDVGAPLSVNIETLLRTLNLSEETLAAAYAAATGNPSVLPEGMSSWHQYISALAADSVLNVFPQYNDLESAVSQWETGHDYYIQYQDAVNEVREGWNQYYSQAEQYNRGQAELNRAIEFYDQMSAEYNAGLAQYNQGLAEYNTGLAEYNNARAELDNGWAQYYAALSRYNAGLTEYETNRDDYLAGLAEYEDGSARYEEGLAEYEQGLRDCENSRAQLEAAEEEYAEGLAEYEDGLAQYENATSSVNMDNESRFLFADASVNSSFCIIRRTGGNLIDIGRTFTAVFVIIAALVIYATLGRIVDEQRTQIGTNKALGFFNHEVLSKYLTFGLSGTVAGTVIGTVLGYFVVLPIVMKGYSHNYVYGAGKYTFIPYLAVIVIVAAILLSSLTIIFACLNMLTTNAITLLAPPVPKTRKRRGRARQALFLYPKLLVMNMLSDKKRVIATIVSVMGCCTLLAAGFGMQFAIKDSISNQFVLYEHYDYKVKYDRELNPQADEQVLEALTRNGTRYIALSDNYRATRIGQTTLGIELVCTDLDGVNDFFTLNDAATGEHLDSSRSGIWIHQKLSEYYSVGPGDTLIIYDSRLNPYEITIAGIYENNLGFYSFMSPENYVSIFGEEPEYNSYLIFQNANGPLNLESDIGQIDGIKEFKNNIELRDYYLGIASALDALSILFIAMSAMLAYFILLNLVSMLINQKKKELTIMRINGFSLWKTINYVAGELAVCTVIGIIIGLVCGNGLEMSILKLLESDQLRFEHEIQWNGCLYSALITIFFTALVSVPVLRKIKHLQLTDMTS